MRLVGRRHINFRNNRILCGYFLLKKKGVTAVFGLIDQAGVFMVIGVLGDCYDRLLIPAQVFYKR